MALLLSSVRENIRDHIVSNHDCLPGAISIGFTAGGLILRVYGEQVI
jgi:hypothetical protein